MININKSLIIGYLKVNLASYSIILMQKKKGLKIPVSAVQFCPWAPQQERLSVIFTKSLFYLILLFNVVLNAVLRFVPPTETKTRPKYDRVLLLTLRRIIFQG